MTKHESPVLTVEVLLLPFFMSVFPSEEISFKLGEETSKTRILSPIFSKSFAYVRDSVKTFENSSTLSLGILNVSIRVFSKNL